MRWTAIALAAVLAAATAQAAEPTLQERAKALLAKPPPPDDLFRLKHDMGAERFTALTNAVSSQAFAQPETKAGEPKMTDPCIAGPATMRLLAVINLARMTDDDGQWRARLAEGENALKKWTALRDGEIEQAEQRLRDAGSAPDSRRAKLARRVALDQFVRLSFPDFLPDGGWAQGASAPVRQYLNTMEVAEGCAVDRDNVAWLRDEIAHRGWPRISSDGKDADHAAFLIVQHAVLDPAWQAQVLAQLGELAPKGETDPKNYAYLFDRVTNKRGGLQRYGSQGHCAGAGDWRPFDSEPGDLDARRSMVGLPSEAAYVAGNSKLCRKADGG